MFEVAVVRVEKVENHPTRDTLTVNTLSNGAIAVSNRTDDSSARYAVGDLVVHIPERAIVPEWLLKHQHCWDDAKGKGTCAGSKGNRVKNRNFDGIMSEGMLYAGEQSYTEDLSIEEENRHALRIIINGETSIVFLGDNLMHIMGITEWEG
jgi:hypothetical protein